MDDISSLDVSVFDEDEEEISRLLEKTKQLQQRLRQQDSVPPPEKSPYTSPFPPSRVAPREPDLEPRGGERELFVEADLPDRFDPPSPVVPTISRSRRSFAPPPPAPPEDEDEPARDRPPRRRKKRQQTGSGRNVTLEKYRMGMLCYERREFTRALEFFGQALSFYGRYRLEDVISLSNIFLSMGNCYYCQGHFDTAFDMYIRVNETIQKRDEIASRGIITPFVNMGLVCLHREEFEEATSFFLKALKAAENIVGIDRLVLADIYHNLGVVFDSQGNLVGALKMYKKSLRIRERLLGSNHPLTALTNENMAMILADCRKFKQAIALQRSVIQVRRTFVGSDNCDFAMALHKMGVIFHAYGAKAKALYHFERAHKLRSKLLGEGHTLTKESYRLRNSILMRKKS